MLAQASTEQKNRALRAIARAIRAHETAHSRGQRAGLRARVGRGIEIDRLRLTPERVAAMARDVEAVGGAARSGGRGIRPRLSRPNGLKISKRRVPLGVVGVVYESRPNVTSDVAALCLKTGNAVVLRGGKEALESNRAIVAAIHQGLSEAGLPAGRRAADHVDGSRRRCSGC